MIKKATKRGLRSAATPKKGKPATKGAATRLSKTAYQLIMDALFHRRIAAGAYMSQSELVELLGVPIQPLRDALRVLEVEGLVKIHPRAGIEFIKADMDLIRSTYQFRTIIECEAVRRYAERAPIEEIEALLAEHHEFIEEMERNGVDPLPKLHRLESHLHGGLIGSLANPLIETTTKRLQNYTSLILMDRRETAPLISRTLREHVKILEACRDRNVELAASEMMAHLNAAMHRAMGL
jgi:DNA-binding GntR family transcriptional regulator